jgi:hypothetical protein
MVQNVRPQGLAAADDLAGCCCCGRPAVMACHWCADAATSTSGVLVLSVSGSGPTARHTRGDALLTPPKTDAPCFLFPALIAGRPGEQQAPPSLKCQPISQNKISVAHFVCCGVSASLPPPHTLLRRQLQLPLGRPEPPSQVGCPAALSPWSAPHRPSREPVPRDCCAHPPGAAAGGGAGGCGAAGGCPGQPGGALQEEGRRATRPDEVRRHGSLRIRLHCM